ncbi:hypothetical protein F53441_2756 [Fusarium austroafricanum]|uniref:AAA+ ATPase domain-containing protein n=1 Tax=Fusarium austroafricanum TaxID=2364996 RepID=A0A8H4KSW4_9HYPO|nr:hypothetical protein F53441_2756 [Fusarium austroafricanum]
MAETVSVIPSDRQDDLNSNKKTTQQEPDTAKANEADPVNPTAATSELAERAAKASSGSKKSKQQKKEKAKATKPASVHDEADNSSTSSGDSTSDDDQDSDTRTLSSKKHLRVNGVNKKRIKNAISDKEKSSKVKIKKQKKSKKKSKKKKQPATSSDSESDSDPDFASSDSDSSDDDDDEPGAKDEEIDSPNLKSQLRALELQVAQLHRQLSNSSGLVPSANPDGYVPSINPNAFSQSANSNPFASFGSSAPSLFQHPSNHMLSQVAGLTSSAARRRPGRLPPGLRSRVPELQASDPGIDTNEYIPGEKKGKSKKVKGPAFKRVDQVWDTNIHNYKLQDTADTGTDSQYEEFIFHVRRTFDWEGKHVATIVDIKSKLLRECLQDVIGNVETISLVDEIPRISPETLFLYLEDLRSHLKALRKAKPAGNSKKARKKNKSQIKEKKKQLKVLINYLDHDFDSTKESLYPMLRTGLITFDLLWALWKPGILIYTTTYGSTSEPRAFKVESAHLLQSLVRGSYYHIEGKYMEFDGKRFGYGNISIEIDSFQGAKKIRSLPCYPMKYHHNEKNLRLDLIERGKKFVSLSGVHYRNYQGIAFMKRKNGSVMKFNIQSSRAMIDPTIFRRINPNYSVSTVKPKDPDIIEESSDSESGNCCDCSDSEDGEKVKFVRRVYKDENGEVRMARFPKSLIEDRPENTELDELPSKNLEGDGGGDVDEEVDDVDLTEEDYLIASPVVLGFSFSEKQWLELAVSCIREIKWNEKAWDSLVLEDGTKDLIKALVKSRKYHAANTIDDVIQGKGKGLVTVLHGPPGTGKTLTAEGIGELLQCPLYMVSAGELGTDSRFLEAELQKILDICHAWGAILLLDEADVFLEKRNMHDIHRNALTFDEAFQSRIHIALRYDNLKAQAKRTIFKMFLDRVDKLGKLKVEPLTDDDLDILSKHALNGREIKNVVGSAQDLAVNKGEALSMRHIRQVLDVHAKFGRDLKGGSGYEDAMRSYF